MSKTRPVRRIGLLGGSFDPAHEGHLFISLCAIQWLHLHELWWLVTPQNPHKAPPQQTFDQRIAQAKEVTKAHKSIIVQDLEQRYDLRSSYETICFLQRRSNRGSNRRHEEHRYIWVMGADGLMDLPSWHHWSRLMQKVAMLIFARAPYQHRALRGKAAVRFSESRHAARQCHHLAAMKPPAWIFLHTKRMPHASRLMRAQAPIGQS